MRIKMENDSKDFLLCKKFATNFFFFFSFGYHASILLFVMLHNSFCLRDYDKITNIPCYWLNHKLLPISPLADFVNISFLSHFLGTGEQHYSLYMYIYVRMYVLWPIFSRLILICTVSWPTWISYLCVVQLLSAVNCWLKCMLLDPYNQTDHPECKSRPDSGLSAITELDPGYITGVFLFCLIFCSF